MRASPHPQLDGLFHGAATPAQWLDQARSAQSALAAVAGGLERLGFEASDPWAALLEWPLAQGGGGSGLQAALDHLAAAAAPAAAPGAAAVPSPRASAAVAAAAAERAAAAAVVRPREPKGLPARGVPAQDLAAGGGPQRDGRGAASPVGRAVSSNAQRTAAGISARSAAATWRQRATDAGLLAAYAGPLQAAARLPGSWADITGTPARVAGAGVAPVPTGPAAAMARALAPRDAGSDQPVQQRLDTLLERLGQRTATATVQAGVSAARPGRSPRLQDPLPLAPDAADGVMRVPGAARPAAAAGDAAAQIHRTAAAPRAVLPAGGGLRGLAARAAAWQPALPDGEASSPRNGLPMHTAPGTATAPGTSTAAGPASTLPAVASRMAPADPSPLSDDQLVDQLARLLKREAQRDGIDVSDVSP